MRAAHAALLAQVKSGNDDLRQDAVMQQFFWLLNRFLADEAATARRSLSIKTYKVGGWSWSWLGWGGRSWLAGRGKPRKPPQS